MWEQDEEEKNCYLFKHLNCVHCQRWWRRLCTLWLCKSSTKASLAGVQESRWLGVLALCLSPRGSWRSLYKPPTEKGSAHLHGRVVIHVCWSYKQTCDTYRFKITVVFLPSQAKKTLQQLCSNCGSEDSICTFGPKYSATEHRMVCLINFLIGWAHRSIWVTRRNEMMGIAIKAELRFKRLVGANLKIEFVNYEMVWHWRICLWICFSSVVCNVIGDRHI